MGGGRGHKRPETEAGSKRRDSAGWVADRELQWTAPGLRSAAAFCSEKGLGEAETGKLIPTFLIGTNF